MKHGPVARVQAVKNRIFHPLLQGQVLVLSCVLGRAGQGEGMLGSSCWSGFSQATLAEVFMRQLLFEINDLTLRPPICFDLKPICGHIVIKETPAAQHQNKMTLLKSLIFW